MAGLNQELFESHSLALLRMHAWIAEHVKIFGDGELAIVAIPKAVEERLGVTDAELGNLSSYARSKVSGISLNPISGVLFVAIKTAFAKS